VHSVMVITEDFEPIARATLESRGRQDHDLVVLPASTAWADRPQLAGAAAKIIQETFRQP
jgi:hypothetical protein